MKIGILQTGHAPDVLIDKTGDYSNMFQRLLTGQGFTFQTWSVVDMEFPASIHDAEGWLLTGSRHGAYDDLPFIAPLEEFIRSAYAASVPMVGVCFGHQIIAQALGGKVEKFSGGWSVGRTVYNFDGRAVALNAWHQDQVTRRPADARVCGKSDFCENAALLYQGRAFTVQPHPEFGSDFIDQLAETRGRGVVPDRLLDKAKTQLDKPTDSSLMARQIGHFFKHRDLIS